MNKELKIQKLVDEFYEYMNSNEFEKFEKENELNNEFIHNAVILYLKDKIDQDKLNEMSIAVALGNFNYQVENGGIHQWVFNRYYKHGINVLIPFLERVICYFDSDTDDYKLAKLILTKFNELVEYDPDAKVWEIDCDECEGYGKVYNEDYDDPDYYDDEYINCEVCYGSGEVNTYDFSEVVRDLLTDEFDSEFYKFDTINIFENWIQKYNEIIKCEGEIEMNNEQQNDKKRITVKLLGEDGNIFNLIGIVIREMRKARINKEIIDQFTKDVKSSNSYDEALQIIMKYVDVK